MSQKHSSSSSQSLMVIAHKSTSEEIGILRKLFQQCDVEKNGVLSFDEFKQAMQSQGLSDDELEEMFDSVVRSVRGGRGKHLNACYSLNHLSSCFFIVSAGLGWDW